MKSAGTISVNPGKEALGRSESERQSIFRQSVIEADKSSRSVDYVALLWPSTGAGVTEFKKYSLPLRALFATILIVAGITVIETPFGMHSVGFGVAEIVFGSLLALGFLTRPVMAAASVYFAVTAALSVRAGNADITLLSMIFGSLLFCAVGSGKYSVDTLIRRAVRQHRAKSIDRKRKEAAGYKAFHYAGF